MVTPLLSPPPLSRGDDAPRVAGFIADVIGAAQPIPCRGGKGAAARVDPTPSPGGHAPSQDGGVGGAGRWGRSGSASVVQKVPTRGRGQQVRPLWARLCGPGGPAATMAAGSECCGPLLPWVRGGGRNSPRHDLSPEAVLSLVVTFDPPYPPSGPCGTPSALSPPPPLFPTPPLCFGSFQQC